MNSSIYSLDNTIGNAYSSTRHVDPEINARIFRSLGSAKTILTVCTGLCRMSLAIGTFWQFRSGPLAFQEL